MERNKERHMEGNKEKHMGSFYGIEEEKIREYARLIMRVGINVQPGQEIVLSCGVEHYEFARLLIEEAYQAGAGEVIMRWGDSFESRQYFLNVSDEVLSTVPQWQIEMYNHYSRRGAGFVSIGGGDPENLKGIDPKRMHLHSAARDKAFEEHNKRLMASEIPWTVAAVPQKNWAKKMFPQLGEEEAMNRLWKMILTSVRILKPECGEDADGKAADVGAAAEGGADIKGENTVRENGSRIDEVCSRIDAVKEWEEHDRFLKEKCRLLNDYAFEKLHYTNSLGTDFTVGLVKNHIWEGGSEVAGTGTVFEANMPTEEIFTMPDRNVAEGTLVSALPLSYRGNLIKNFRITFHEGQAVDYSAEEGLETLRSILEGDEGSRRLGEVALVPYTSPISQMKTLFYNTLFDENASCHFALGDCYPTTVAGGAQMTEEELLAAGGNQSMNHVDFMVGTADLTVTGIRPDGEEVVLFKDGDWAR